MDQRPWISPLPYASEFLEHGYCIVPLVAKDKLDQVRSMLVQGLRSHMPGGDGLSDETYLNQFHRFADPTTLNDVRVKTHRNPCASEEFKHLVFEMVRDPLFELVGNELVMQRQVSFVTHLPKDSTNLIYLHTDAWAGCSPYEVILWLPLVDVFDTKSMYILDKKRNQEELAAMKRDTTLATSGELFERVRSKVTPLNLKYGNAVLFSPTLLHGAVENKTDETRFILNVRFKSLYSPYGTKALGETFTPVNYRPATALGIEHETRFGTMHG